jgi:hypothetical protein
MPSSSSVIRSVSRSIWPGQGVDLVQQHPGELAVVVLELAGQRLDNRPYREGYPDRNLTKVTLQL